MDIEREMEALSPQTEGDIFRALQWVMERRLVPAERDLVLVGKLLDADDRNFHGWGYRRWLARLMGITPEEELEFSHKKV